MLATDILLSIAIVGIYTTVYVYLKTNYKNKKKIFRLFIEGFIIATIINMDNNWAEILSRLSIPIKPWRLSIKYPLSIKIIKPSLQCLWCDKILGVFFVLTVTQILPRKSKWT